MITEQAISFCEHMPKICLLNPCPIQPPFKLRISKMLFGQRLTSLNRQATSNGSDQTAHLRKLVCAFAGNTCHIVGNLMLLLIW